jgi:hypothetical protein
MKYGLIVLFLIINTTLFAKLVGHAQITAVPNDSQYCIIQSEISASMTFRLNKYTGEVLRMLDGNRGPFWQQVRREKHLKDIQKKGSVNYQLFTSGLNTQMIYLLNINTGATWHLSENSKLGYFWKAIK